MRFLTLLSAAIVMVAVTVGITASPTSVLSAEKHEMEVEDAWSRARPATAKVGGAFMMIHNEGSKTDRLIAASSPIAKRVEIHESLMKDGVMSMAQITDLPIKPGEKVMLKPGSYHVMLMGLNRPLVEGEMFPLTLKFEFAGDIKVMVHVKAAGAMSGGHTH